METKSSIFSKITSVLKKNKSLLIHSLWLVLGVVAVSVVSLMLLVAFNIVYFDDGMKFNSELFMSFKSECRVGETSSS